MTTFAAEPSSLPSRGGDVILAFGAGAGRLTLYKVAARTGVDRAVARHSLMTLVALGFAENDGPRLSLTPQRAGLADVVNVARAEAADRPLRHARTVSGRRPTHATASGRVLMTALSAEALGTCVAKLSTRYMARTVTDRAALRRAVAECREAGFAVLNSELEEGFVSVAVPVTNSTGRFVAALATSSPAGRRDPDALRQGVVPRMKAAASEMAMLSA